MIENTFLEGFFGGLVNSQNAMYVYGFLLATLIVFVLSATIVAWISRRFFLWMNNRLYRWSLVKVEWEIFEHKHELKHLLKVRLSPTSLGHWLGYTSAEHEYFGIIGAWNSFPAIKPVINLHTACVLDRLVRQAKRKRDADTAKVAKAAPKPIKAESHEKPSLVSVPPVVVDPLVDSPFDPNTTWIDKSGRKLRPDQMNSRHLVNVIYYIWRGNSERGRSTNILQVCLAEAKRRGLKLYY